ncbi:MAG: hypothetical protein ACYCQJ_15295 [Nitrososphaerales archaeon]
MPERKFTFGEKEYKCKAWTVADRRLFLKKMHEIQNMANPEDQLNASIEFINDQTGISKEELETWDSILFDQFVGEIVRANNAPPLAQSRR